MLVYYTITFFQYILPLIIISLICVIIPFLSSFPIAHNKVNTRIILLPLVSCISGIYIQHQLSFSMLFLSVVFCIIVLLILSALYLSKPIGLISSLFCLFFITGALLLSLQKAKQLYLMQQFEGKEFSLEGIITGKERQAVMHKKNRFRTKLLVQGTQSIPITCACYLFAPTSLTVGDRVILENIRLPKPTLKTNLRQTPTFADYLLKENITAALFLKNKQIVLKERPYFSLKRSIHTIKTNTYNRLKKKLYSLTDGYFSSLFLGKKNNEEIRKSRNIFAFWGISHFLARSGLHIALFVMLWYTLLGFFPLPFFFKQTILLLLCTLYYLFSWSSLSFLRALTMFFLFQAGVLLKRQLSFIYLLSLLCLTTILFNPSQIFFLDFQLSYALTFGFSILLQKKTG